jgi:AraC-like DNA-binding protein
MTTLEAGLRGGAIALFLLLALVAWRDARRVAVARYSVLFSLCAIGFLVESARPVVTASPAWVVPFRLLSITTPAVFQLWVSANFDDSFKPNWWRWLPFAAVVGLAAWAMAADRTAPWLAVHIAALLLVGFGVWQALAGRAGDLVETRRRFRLTLALCAGFGIGGLTLLAFAVSAEVRAAGSLASAAMLLVLALAACWLALGARTRAQFEPVLTAAPGDERRRAVSLPSVAIDADEQALLDQLQRVMETDRVYREEGFGIAVLADRLGIPEYRLRRLINQRLGHRNFTSFVNGYRLAETIAALSDRSQAAVPVLTIALDAGFQSIGPFNRAFKAETGKTPTEFRRDRLDPPERRAAE